MAVVGRLLIHRRVTGLGLEAIRQLTGRGFGGQQSGAILERQRLNGATKGDLEVVFNNLIEVEFQAGSRDVIQVGVLEDEGLPGGLGRNDQVSTVLPDREALAGAVIEKTDLVGCRIKVGDGLDLAVLVGTDVGGVGVLLANAQLPRHNAA